LRKVSKPTAALPDHAAVLLMDAPKYVGYAVVFDATYDFSAALRIYAGRKDITGETKLSDMPAGNNGGRSFVYRYASDRLDPLAP